MPAIERAFLFIQTTSRTEKLIPNLTSPRHIGGSAMKKMRKGLLIIMAASILITCLMFAMPKKTDAATAGSYYVKVTVK